MRISLRDISLNKLSENIGIYNNKNLKIPGLLGQEIFDRVLQNKSYIDENDLLFFRKENCKLIDVKLFQRFFKNVYFFDFLNNHELTYLTINLRGSLNLQKPDNFLIKTKNLFIKINDIFDKKANELFLSKCCVEEHLDISGLASNMPTITIPTIIGASSEKLKSISIQRECLSFLSFEKVAEKLKEKKHLKHVDISLGYMDIMHSSKKCNYNIAFESLKASSSTLESIKLSESYFCFAHSNKYIEEFLNLQSISIGFCTLEIDSSKSIAEFFDIFSNQSEMYLKSIHFDCSIQKFKTEITHQAFLKFLFKCKNLINVKFSGISFVDGSKIYDSLMPSFKSLSILHLTHTKLDINCVKSLQMVFQESKIIEFRLIYVDFLNDSFDYFTKSFNFLKKHLSILEISCCHLSGKDLKNLALSLENISKLRQFCIEENELYGESFNYICKYLKTSSNKINDLNFTLKTFREEECRILSEFIINCKYLSAISLRSRPSSSELSTQFIPSILNDLNHELLEKFHLEIKICEPDLIKIIKFLSNCYNLESVIIRCEPVNHQLIQNLEESLRSSKSKLKHLELIDMFDNANFPHWLANKFNSYLNFSTFGVVGNVNQDESLYSLSKMYDFDAYCINGNLDNLP